MHTTFDTVKPTCYDPGSPDINTNTGCLQLCYFSKIIFCEYGSVR